MSKSGWALSAMTACAAVLMMVLDIGGAAYTTDSMIYISAADSIKQGEGLMMSNFDILPVMEDTVPLKFYPPGFPYLLALFAYLGVHPLVSAVLLSKISFICLPLIFFFVFRQLMTKAAALTAAFISTFITVSIKFSLFALTDLPFLALSALALGLAMRSLERERGKYMFIAGILTGICIALRYLGAVLPLSIGFALLMASVMRIIPFAKCLRWGLKFVVGCALSLFPLMASLLARPAGTEIIQEASIFSIPEVMRTYILILTQIYLGDAVHAWGFALAFMILLGALCAIILNSLKQGGVEAKKYLNVLLLAAYALGGSAVVIFMVSKYRYYLDDRYILQYVWAFNGLMIVSVAYFMHRVKDKMPVKETAAILVFVFMIIQSFAAMDAYFFFADRQRAFQSIVSGDKALQSIPEDSLIVSNRQDMVNLLTQRSVRMMADISPLGLDKVVGDQRPLFVVLSLEDAYDLPGWRPVLYGKIPAGYTVNLYNGKIAILQRIGSHQ